MELTDKEHRLSFVEGVLDKVEGEIPVELWETKARDFEKWRKKAQAGLLANWDEFNSSPMSERARLMRLYCLGVVQGMSR